MKKPMVRSGLFLHATVAVAALAFAGLMPLPAQATDAANAPADTAKNTSKKKTAKPAINKAKFVPGSSETPAQRNSRMKRECKGAVNAGACTGYTR